LTKRLSNRINKRSARRAVHRAIRKGKLIRPTICERCGKGGFDTKGNNKLQAHHWSYKQKDWLDVEWLCDSCHKKEHKK